MQEGEANRTAAVVTEDILGRLGRRGQGYWIAVIALGVLALLGVMGVVVRLTGGAEGRVGWAPGTSGGVSGPGRHRHYADVPAVARFVAAPPGSAEPVV